MRAVDVIIVVGAAVLVVLAWAAALRARVELRAHRAEYRHTSQDLEAARRDTLVRSHAVVSGKVREHLTPLFPAFLEQFDARDARFLGSPVDFVVFDGLDAGDVDRVVFVEIKTGRSGLSARERRVREAVEEGRVEWQLLRLPDVEPAPPPGPDPTAPRALRRPARRRAD